MTNLGNLLTILLYMSLNIYVLTYKCRVKSELLNTTSNEFRELLITLAALQNKFVKVGNRMLKMR